MNYLQIKKQMPSIKGNWSYNEKSDEYTISVAGKVAIYTIFSPDYIDGCTLIKGTHDAADLKNSWFEAHIDPSEYQDPPDPQY